ncbi:MAG: hypothetical protein K2J40_05400 [Ruminococcus sp.]|nr:hypothetical protein [Ruminococcus sp.]
MIQEFLPHDFWNQFDFSDGEIHFMYTSPEEDLLFVTYPDRLSLDAGYLYDGTFGIYISWDNNCPPVARYVCKTIEDFAELMQIALEQIQTELEQRRFSYYGELWKTIEIIRL